MSLQLWLPLNGNLNNQGISDLPVTNSNCTFVDSGKIGKAISIPDNGMLSLDMPFTGAASFTLATWVKCNTATSTASRTIFSLNLGSNTAAVQGGVVAYTANNKNLCFYCSGNLITEIAVEPELWNHITFTGNGNSLSLYVNGKFQKSWTGTYNFGAGKLTFGRNNLGGSSLVEGLVGSMCDIRVYDECLSQTEISRIAEGLILDYEFNDPEIEPTTNIDPCKNSMNSNSLVSLGNSNNRLTVTANQYVDDFKCFKMVINTEGSISSWHGWYLNSNPISQGATIGQTVIRSCYMYIPSGQTMPGHFTPSIEGNSSNKVLKNYDFNNCNTWQRIYLKGTITDSGSNNYLFYFGAVSSGSYNCTFYVRDFQMEINDHITPYTESTRNEQIIYDESGNENNGELLNTMKLLPDNIVGHYALLPNSNSHIKILRPVVSPSQMSCEFWIKPATSNTYSIIASNYNNPGSGFWLAVNCEGSGLWYYRGAYAKGVPMLNVGVWYHVVWVFDNGIIRWYLNGVLQSTTDQTVKGTTLALTDYIAIGNSYTGTQWNTNFTSMLGNFRIYATALSAERIADLYKVKQKIDRNGALYSNNFTEANENLLGDQQFNYTGIGAYTQSNCIATYTNSGINIVRPANKTVATDGNTMWGGPYLYNQTSNAVAVKNTTRDNVFGLQKGHRYKIMIHVKGKTSNASEQYWTNSCGWGGGGVAPNPSDIKTNGIPANFDGEMDFWYEWTINDDIYKTCTKSYSSYVIDTVYLSYRHFKLGWNYTDTGVMGTNIIFSNFRLYDITNEDTKLQFQKNGVIVSPQFIETSSTNTSLNKATSIRVNTLIED